MTAREMFENLGFILKCDDDGQILYFDPVYDIWIRFCKSLKAYECVRGTRPLMVYMIEHKAIHKQCEELGWLR